MVTKPPKLLSLSSGGLRLLLSRFSRVRLCDPMDCTPPGSSVHGILQARILEWVAMPFSRVCSQPKDRTHLSFISLPLVPPGKPESPNKLYEKISNRYLYPLHLVKTVMRAAKRFPKLGGRPGRTILTLTAVHPRSAWLQ